MQIPAGPKFLVLSQHLQNNSRCCLQWENNTSIYDLSRLTPFLISEGSGRSSGSVECLELLEGRESYERQPGEDSQALKRGIHCEAELISQHGPGVDTTNTL